VNKNIVVGFLIGFFIVVGLGGCSDPFQGPEQSKEEGVGQVQVRIGLKQAEARTFLPTVAGLYFTLEFTAEDKPAVQESLSNTEGTVILAPGTWDLLVKAYQDEASVSLGNVLLEGTVTGILISVGESVAITVPLRSPSEKSGQGTLTYTVSFPLDVGVKTGTLTVTDLDGEVIEHIDLYEEVQPDETGGSVAGTLSLSSGMYWVRVALDGAEGMIRSIDIVHISEGLNTPAVYSFENTDFVFDGTLSGVLKALEASTSLKDAYTFELIPGNETLSPSSFDLNGASILIDGQGRTISLGGETGELLSIGNGVSLTLKNMTLQGRGPGSSNISALVQVEGGGVLNLGEGVLITNNYNSSSGGGVYVDGGSFTMGSDARIEGNAAVQQGGGVYVASGTFRKEGGIIKENTAESGRGYGVSLAGGKYRNDDSGTEVLLYAAYDGSKWIYSDASFGDTTDTWEIPIKAFRFEGLSGLGIGEIDEMTKRITVVVPYGSDLTQLVPVIESSSGVMVSPGSGMARDFTGPVEYGVSIQGGVSEVYTVTVTVGFNTAKAITGFSFTNPNAEGSINEDDKTINVMVPYGTDPMHLTPTITVSPEATVNPNSGQAQDFTNSVMYTVTAQDGSSKQYTVSVTIAEKSQGIVTLIFPTDKAAGALDDTTITISRISTEGNPVEHTLVVNGTYTAYQWWVDGVLQEGTDSSFTLSASAYTIGVHRVTLKVITDNNLVYSKELTFRVER
jgi:hypothetical protein